MDLWLLGEFLNVCLVVAKVVAAEPVAAWNLDCIAHLCSATTSFHFAAPFAKNDVCVATVFISFHSVKAKLVHAETLLIFIVMNRFE